MDDNAWYMTIRKYNTSGPPAEVGRSVREGLLPVLKQEPHFRAYYAARMDGGRGVFAVSVFADRGAMLEANSFSKDWVVPNLEALLTAVPEVTIAAVTVHLDAAQQGHDSYVLIRVTEGLPPFSAVLPTVQESLVPLTSKQPGFRHLYSGRVEAQSDLAVSVSVFSNRSTATATAAHAQVAALMAQHQDIWPKPARIVMSGEVIVAASAKEADHRL